MPGFSLSARAPLTRDAAAADFAAAFLAETFTEAEGDAETSTITWDAGASAGRVETVTPIGRLETELRVTNGDDGPTLEATWWFDDQPAAYLDIAMRRRLQSAIQAAAADLSAIAAMPPGPRHLESVFLRTLVASAILSGLAPEPGTQEASLVLATGACFEDSMEPVVGDAARLALDDGYEPDGRSFTVTRPVPARAYIAARMLAVTADLFADSAAISGFNHGFGRLESLVLTSSGWVRTVISAEAVTAGSSLLTYDVQTPAGMDEFEVMGLEQQAEAGMAANIASLTEAASFGPDELEEWLSATVRVIRDAGGVDEHFVDIERARTENLGLLDQGAIDAANRATIERARGTTDGGGFSL